MKKALEEVYLIYEHKCMLYDTNKIEDIETPSKKKVFCANFTPLDNIISHSIYIPCSELEDSDGIEIQIEFSLYEEVGLDRNKEYIIGYIPFSSSEKSLCHIQAFAIEKTVIETLLAPFHTSHSAIDIVGISPLLYSVLYADNILERVKETEIFFHIGVSESFIALYYQGKFISFKQIPSLEQIAKRLEIDIGWLLEYLYSYGFDESLWEKDDIETFYYIQESFYEILYRVNHSLRQKIEKLGLSMPKNIWIDDDNGVIPKLDILLDNLGYIKSKKEALPKPEIFSSLHPYLEARYALLASKGLFSELPNFTPFPASPIWYKTHIGHLGITLGITIIALISIETIDNMLLDRQKTELKHLKNRIQNLNNQKIKYRSVFKKIKKEILDKKNKIKELKVKKEAWEESATLAKSMRSSSFLRHKIEKDVDMALAKEKIKVDKFEEIGSNKIVIDITVPTLQRYKIGAFMEDLKEKGYSTVDTALIEREAKYFHSKIEVSR